MGCFHDSRVFLAPNRNPSSTLGGLEPELCIGSWHWVYQISLSSSNNQQKNQETWDCGKKNQPVYPLVNVYITMERSTICYNKGKSTMSMVIFNSYFDITRGYMSNLFPRRVSISTSFPLARRGLDHGTVSSDVGLRVRLLNPLVKR